MERLQRELADVRTNLVEERCRHTKAMSDLDSNMKLRSHELRKEHEEQQAHLFKQLHEAIENDRKTQEQISHIRSEREGMKRLTAQNESEIALLDKEIALVNQELQSLSTRFGTVNQNLNYHSSKEDDARLLQLFALGKSIKELCEIFGRNRGAITSRLKKLNI